MKYLFPLLAFVLLFQFPSHAQQGFFEEGYLLLKGDTVRGWLERTDEIKLSVAVTFKTAPEAAPQVYSPQEIAVFGFTQSGIQFQAVEALLRQNETRETEIRFAKVLLTGPASLYQLRLQEKEQAENNELVFILQKDSTYYTLAQYKLHLESRVGVENRYRGTLTALLDNCPTLAPEITRLPFKAAPIVALVKKYNTCTNPSYVSVEHPYKVPATIKQGPELALGRVFTPSHHDIYNTQAYSIGYFWDYQKPDQSRKLSYHYGINYLYVRYAYDTQEYSGQMGKWITMPHSEEIHYLRAPLLAQLNFHNAPDRKFSPFFNFGLTAQASTYRSFSSLNIIPFLSLGIGAYYKQLRVAVLVDNEGFYINSNKLSTLSFGWILGSPGN